MAKARNSHLGTLLSTGKVLVTGGHDSTGPGIASCELYDPALGTWSSTGSLAAKRYGHTATLLPSGKVMTTAGYDASLLATCEIYDPVAGTWSATAGLATPREDHCATLLPSGRILVSGGFNNGMLATCEVYDPNSGAWGTGGTMPSAQYVQASTLLASGKVLLTGGSSTGAGAATAACALYDPTTNTSSATGSMATARYGHVNALLRDGRVLIAGGYGTAYLASCEIYDPAAGTCATTGGLATARRFNDAILLPSGKVLATGGFNGSLYLASCELFDPNLGTWAATANMTATRNAHTSTLLSTGKVLVAGGFNGSSLSTCELYDPAIGTWAATGSMLATRHLHRAILLPTGKLLVVGGVTNGTTPTATCEIYDPIAGTWSATGSISAARSGHSLTLLPSGKVLMSGGGVNAPYYSSCEIYDPTFGTWSATASMAAGRSYHTTTLLASGKIFAAGGFDGVSVKSSCELFDYGLAFSVSDRPVIATAPSTLTVASTLQLTGTLFTGKSEASSGQTNSSPTNYPLVQIQSAVNGMQRWLPFDSTANYSATAVSTQPATGLPYGPAWVRVFVNGIYSDAKPLTLTKVIVPPTVAITAPAAGANFGAPASITITANAADSDGTVTKVEFFQGSTSLGVDTSSPFSITWANVAIGSYSLTAKATDDDGTITTSAPVAITVSTNVAPAVALTAPVANAGFAAPANIVLAATASDSDGTITKVEFYQGASLIGIATTSPYTATWNGIPAGSYSFTAKATDSSGAITTSTAVPVSVFTNPPTVSLTSPVADTVFQAPASVTLTATATDDVSVAKVDFYNGTTLLNSDTASPYTYAWTNVAAGSYSLTAKATDDVGGYTTSIAVPIVVNAQPTVSISAPANNASFPAPATVTINATAADSDGTISKVEFYDGATLLNTDAASPYSYVWSNPAKGAHALTAKAYDDRGGLKTSSTVNITITNTAPTVALTAPIADQRFAAPASITMTATAGDVDGTVTKVEFFNGGSLLNSDTTAPYSFTWTPVAGGTYPLMARATDSDGAVTSTAYIAVTVSANNPPVADFSLQNAASSYTYTFDGTISSDPDGDAIASYAWTFRNGGTMAVITTSTAAQPTVTFASTGVPSVIVDLTVTDPYGASGSINRTIGQIGIGTGSGSSGSANSSNKKEVYLGEVCDQGINLNDVKAANFTWSVMDGGTGAALIADPSDSNECTRWKTSVVLPNPDCVSSVQVKGTKLGKVKLKVVAQGQPAGSPSTCSSETLTGTPTSTKILDLKIIPRNTPPDKMPLGSKFRRVDAHGIPMPDPSPTGEGEGDRIPNMAYTDMFNLSPTYATTDLSVPVEGGELSLEFRRTMGIKSRNYNTDVTQLSITYPTEDLMGVGWDVNLGSHVVLVEKKNKGGQTYLSAEVVDETGGSYSYIDTGTTFLADIGHSFNNEAIKCRLARSGTTELVLTKPHGTKLTYEFVRIFFAPFAPDSGCGDPPLIHKEAYYRLKSVTDRNGNRLDYTYNTHQAVSYSANVPLPMAVGFGPNGDLIAKRITFVDNGQPNDNKRFIDITARWAVEYSENAWLGVPTGRDSGWRIEKITDPLGRETKYFYTPFDPNTFQRTMGPQIPLNPLVGLLQRVERPSVSVFKESTGTSVDDTTEVKIPTVQFTYYTADLLDIALDPANPKPLPQPWEHKSYNRFVAPATITDANGHVTTMTYSPPEWFPVSFYPSLASFVWQPRFRLATMQTNDGTATFSMPAFPNAYVINMGTSTIELTTDVTDVRGVKTTFKFFSKIVLVPNEVGAAMYATKFIRSTAGTSGNGNTGNATFEWSDPYGLPDPNGNLTKVTDMSGNVITFSYVSGAAGDLYDQGMVLPTGTLNAYANPNHYMAFNKPAKRTVDPTGLNLVTQYRHETAFNKEKEQIDAEGKRTVYLFDAQGNRTEVQEAVGTTVARTTKYAYAANGFVTQVTDPDNRVTTSVLSFPAAALPVPAGMGVGGEPAPTLVETYKSVVSTVKGYANELTLATTTISDVMGNARWTTDPRNNSTRMFYDVLNRTVKVMKPAVVNTAGATVTSTSETFYDLNGNARKAIDDELNATVTTYDPMNRPLTVRRRMTNPLRNYDVDDLITSTNYRHGSDLLTAPSVGLPRFTLDANGKRTDYVYDNLLRLTTTTFPTVTVPGVGPVTYTTVNTYGVNSGSGAFAYWSGWQPVRVKDKRGYVTDTQFDKIYRPAKVIQRASLASPPADPYATPGSTEPTVETYYNKVHKPIRSVTLTTTFSGTAANQTTWTSYDSLYRPTVMVVDVAGSVPTPATFVEDGLAFTTTSTTALVTATAYDKAGNATTAKDPLGRQTVNVYDGAARLTQTTQPSVTIVDPKAYNPNGALSPVTKVTYDAAGNRTLVEDANHTKTQTAYDARNRPIQTIVDLSGEGTFNATTYVAAPPANADIVTSTRYNLVGKPVKVTDSRGFAADTVYDRAYRTLTVTSPAVANAQNGGAMTQPVVTTTYDKNGNVLTMQDARQKVHAPTVMLVNTYDELNRLRTSTQASGATEALTTETRYDANNNVLELHCNNSAGSGGNQVTVYTYDAFNRKLTETLPTVADALLRRTTLTYYRNGALKTSTDPKGQITECDYDRAGRVTTSRHKTNTTTTYETRVSTWSKTGKLLTVSDLNGSSTYVYDNLDRVVTETRATTGQTTYSVDSAYDAIGQRTRVIYPATARTSNNHFDRAGRLEKVNDGGKDTVFTYDVCGNRLTVVEPPATGITTANVYDALGRCQTSFTRKGATTVSDFTYSYDLVGNRVTVIENLALQGSRTITYTYDAKYQLLSEAWSTPATYSNTYVYDLAGNRTKVTNVNNTTTTVTDSTYDTLNRLMTSTKGGVGTTYTYDLNGNQATEVTGAVTTTFTWDVSNRLLGVVQGANTLAASYDYRTRRLTTNAGGTRYFRYDQGVSFHELLGSALQVEFLRGPDMGGGIGSILYSDRTMVSGGIEESFSYNPAVGNMVALTNSAGAAVQADRYDAFGNIVTASGSSLNNRLANTKERGVVGTLALDNHGFRYYNPGTGRYISRDPIGYGDGLNVYLYVKNNPINRIDPLGLYDSAGHFWTTYIAAREAGKSDEAALKLAYYSQLPDREGRGTDAIGSAVGKNAVATAAIFLSSPSAMEVQAGGHMLLSQINKLECERVRARMKGFVSERINAIDGSEESYQDAGFAIHAYGDSYSHTLKGDYYTPFNGGQFNPDGERGFDWGWGHLDSRMEDNGKEHDYINYSKSSFQNEKYRKYVEGLYGALGGRDFKDNDGLKKFLDFTKKLGDGHENQAARMEEYARAHYGYKHAYTPTRPDENIPEGCRDVDPPRAKTIFRQQLKRAQGE